MAQTKKQKQQKALEYWQNHLEIGKRMKWNEYSINYIQDQINRLTRKLNPAPKNGYGINEYLQDAADFGELAE